MVEGKRSNPLLEQIAQQRRAQEAQRLSEAQAEQMLPDFKAKLGSLISAKVPPPEEITKKITLLNMFDRDKIGDHEEGRRRRIKELGTKLTATVPLEDGTTTSVTISASGYPEADNPESVKGLDYQIDVGELGRVLIIEGAKATLQSKQWKHEPITPHTPIGVPLSSWPAWQRPARVEDIEQYQSLLEGLNQEGVVFEGSTPPIINRDYSGIGIKPQNT